MRLSVRWAGVGLAVSALFTTASADRPITVTILHNNDLHAHIEPTMIAKKPYGGYARIATLLKKYRASDPNPIYLNAGDTFQGTIYFNVYEGLADVAILNAMGLQAMALGNHEFDRGPKPLATFIQNATFPVLSSNLAFSDSEPLKSMVLPYTVLTVSDEKVGVVGATVEDLANISSPGPTVSQSNLLSSVQKSVDELTKQGVNKIILLSHIGYQEDIQLAKKLRNVDVIIGGHSHSPLGTPSITGWPKPAGPYPTIVPDSTGRNVYIAQSWEWGKVFGRMKVDFDDQGQVVRVTDAEAIPVDASVPEDPVIKSLVTALHAPIAAQANSVVGSTPVELPQQSLMGYVLADAMLAATKKSGAVVAFTNAGGVRGGIPAGPITYGQAISVAPFSNTLVLLDLKGSELVDILKAGILIPSQGFRYSRSGAVSPSLNGAPLESEKVYRCCFNSFIANGGDSMFGVRDSKGARSDTGIVDIDALTEYLRQNNPVKVDPTSRRE
jgi:5'-nucleotidase